MAASNSSSQEVMSEINIVPLVDIILVVLIIFMVTATQFSSKEINVDLPKAGSGGAASNQPLVAQVSAAGKVYVDGQEVDEQQLREETERRLSENAELTAVVSADSAAPHGAVIRVMDAVKSAGVDRLAVSVQEEP